MEDSLLSVSTKELADQKYLASFVKSIVEGDECTITGHLVDCENSLGRSTVIDLKSTGKSPFRQVDHRSINFLIINNVKYVLKGKGAKAAGEEPEPKKGEPLWDASKLEVGNTFSGTKYYKAEKILGDTVQTKCDEAPVIVSRDVIEC